MVWAGLNPAPDVPLNVPIGSHRRVRWVQSRLGDFKAIKNSLGGTVNDVVLAVVAARCGAGSTPRRPHRGARAACPGAGLDSRRDERGSIGNRIAAMRGPLPVYADDPVERLRIVREAMGD